MVGPNRPTTGCMCGCTAEIAALKAANEKLREQRGKVGAFLSEALDELEAVPRRFDNPHKALAAEVFYYDMAPRWSALVRHGRAALARDGGDGE